jgi:hypothetical protein
MGPKTCPSCGVVFPVDSLRCPSCDRRPKPDARSLGLIGLTLALIFASACIGYRQYEVYRSLKTRVTVTSSGFALAPDGMSRDASATIINTNRVMVDVTIRVQWFDTSDKLVSEETFRPCLKMAPGEKREVSSKITLMAIPMDHVTFEVLKVDPTKD